jgi:hypothetical protein
LRYYENAVVTKQAYLKDKPQKCFNFSFDASSQANIKSNHLHGSRSRAVLTNDKFLKVAMYAENTE